MRANRSTSNVSSRPQRPRARLRERWAERGFSAADLLNLWRPIGAWEKHDSLPYGPAPRQMLDVYRPRHAAGAPLLVFFYGGSWQNGSRDLYPFLGTSLAAQGIVTIIPDYPVFPTARFPEFLQGAARAVAFAHAEARQWGADAGKLVLMGHSAGAHIAAMLAYDPQWLAAVGLEARRDVAGVIGLAGPYDFLPIRSRVLQRIFGGPERPETQPISFVTGHEAPTLLIAAKRDALVDPGNTHRFAAKIRELGGVVEEREYARVNHFTLIGSFAPGLRLLAPTLRDVTDFVWRVTARGRRQAAN
jgi:acetyl esterase/lipase